jgi:toxin YoeB
MVRQIVWTLNAQEDRRRIFKYWNNRNKSTIYSKKLNMLFRESLKLVCKRPYIGKRTDKNNVRAKIVRDYLIFYEITDSHIVVLTIWDCRQDPEENKYKI